MAELTGDFETIRRGEIMAVWLFDLCDIYTLEHSTFTSIADGLESIKEESTVYFHNLKFDGSYLLDYFGRNGYTWVDESRDVREPGQMNFLITSSSVWFCGVVILKTGVKVRFRDSFKKIPLSVKAIAESYKLPILKERINYTEERPEGYIPTDEEISYIHNDTEIVARALRMHFEQGLTEMTAPADAFKHLKSTVCDSYRKLGIMTMRQDNKQEMEQFCRKAYFGGISWVNPEIENKDVGAGVVYDNNSMYPGVMLNNPYPVYYPTKIRKESELNDCLWIAAFKLVDVTKMDGALPTLRIGTHWIEQEYTGVAYLTSVDYELLLENYYYKDIIFLEGYRWVHTDDRLFKEFVEYWGNRKMQDKGGLRQIDKLMLNSSYGKFGLNPDRCRKQCIYDPIKRIATYPTMKDSKGDKLIERKKVQNNVAIAAFVTAYARRELNKAVKASTGFCYCDTDSVHLATQFDYKRGGVIYPTFSGDIHPTRLGAWKLESEFTRARYIGQKTYIEETRYNEYEVKACGMPANCKRQATWENFKIGTQYPGMLKPKVRPGGVELVEQPFTICARPPRF